MIFGEKFRKKYALSEAGEANVKRGVLWTVVTNLVVFASITFLYLLMGCFMATLTEGLVTFSPAAISMERTAPFCSLSIKICSK